MISSFRSLTNWHWLTSIEQSYGLIIPFYNVKGILGALERIMKGKVYLGLCIIHSLRFLPNFWMQIMLLVAATGMWIYIICLDCPNSNFYLIHRVVLLEFLCLRGNIYMDTHTAFRKLIVLAVLTGLVRLYLQSYKLCFCCNPCCSCE